MAAVERIRELMEELPPEQQQELLDFAQFLSERYAAGRPRRSMYGLWAGKGIEITDEDIEEVRREMWANFPREDIP